MAKALYHQNILFIYIHLVSKYKIVINLKTCHAIDVVSKTKSIMENIHDNMIKTWIDILFSSACVTLHDHT